MNKQVLNHKAIKTHPTIKGKKEQFSLSLNLFGMGWRLTALATFCALEKHLHHQFVLFLTRSTKRYTNSLPFLDVYYIFIIAVFSP